MPSGGGGGGGGGGVGWQMPPLAHFMVPRLAMGLFFNDH